MSRPHICIATPCAGGQVFQNYFLSTIKLIYETQRQNDVDLSFILRGGAASITHTRNSIVAEFLATPHYTHLLWIDADVGFEPDAVYRLLDSDLPVAAGIYPMKTMTQPVTYQFNPVKGGIKPEDGFFEVTDVGCGLMMIQREVFDDMIIAYPELKYRPDRQIGLDALAAKTNDLYYNFFDTMVDDAGRYLSEDFAFCRRWQMIGGRVMCDAKSKLTHQGSHLYAGDVGRMLAVTQKS